MKKKKEPTLTPAQALKRWDPTASEKKVLLLIPYDLRWTESGFEKIKGLTVLFEKEIAIYENGEKKGEYPLARADGALALSDSASTRLLLQYGRERVLLGVSDLRAKERFSACALALTRYLEEGVFLAPAAIRAKVCPKCGRPYRPGSTSCTHCNSEKRQVKWLFSMLKPLIPMLLLSFLLFVGFSLVNLIPPALSEMMVDGYLKDPAADGSMIPAYLAVVGAMLVCTAIQRLLSALRSVVSAKVGCKAILQLRNAVFEKVQQMSLAAVNRRTVGELMQRVNDDTTVLKNFLISDLGEILEKVALFLAVGGILIYNDVQNGTFLFLLVFIPAVPCVLLYRLFHQKIRRIYRSQWQVTSRASSLLHDIFSGIRVVKSFGREKDEIDRYDGAIRSVRDVQKRNELFWAAFSPLLSFMMYAGEFLVLYFVGNKILGGTMSIGEMTKLTAYTAMVYTPLRSLAFLPRRIVRARTSLNKIFDVMEDDDILIESASPVERPIEGTIEFKNVSFGYEAGRQVLKHVDLTVRPGEMVGLVGRSGVGKSTLINLAMRLYDAEEGQVCIDGVDVKDLSRRSLRKAVGAVLQDTVLFSGTVRSNIAYAKPEASGEEIVAAAKLAGAHDFIMKMPDGYDTYVGERGANLSGGERQRIAIARALLLDPKILILDEATSALDAETEKEIQDALEKLIEGRTTIAIAHRLSTLRNCTKIVVIDDKRIVQCGTHEELMRDESGIYYSLVMAQRKMSSKKGA